MAICPKCNSKDVEFVSINSAKFLTCNECGYDENEGILDVYPEERTSKGGKSSPYKKGGHQRTIKKK